jgi:hypothetical protein
MSSIYEHLVNIGFNEEYAAREAKEWEETFGDEAEKWFFQAECTNIDAARELADAGIDAYMASQTLAADVGIGGYVGTLGYKYANGDLTLDWLSRVAQRSKKYRKNT